MIFVDDASRDGTRAELMAAKAELPALRVLAHARNSGQSRSIRSGVLAARGAIVVTLDGDGQNPPADAPALVDRLAAAPPEVGVVHGRRVGRQDSWAKKTGLAASPTRSAASILGDDADDVGCGLKAIRRELFLRFPYFDHMHRYWPALAQREGFAGRIRRRRPPPARARRLQVQQPASASGPRWATSSAWSGSSAAPGCPER